MVSKHALGFSTGLLAALAACTPSSSTSPLPVTSSAGVVAEAPRQQSLPAPSVAGSALEGGPPAPNPSQLEASAGSGSSASPRHEGPLAAFHDALRELEAGRRKAHVRIVWLGDSHAQADFWTGGVRSALQARFGNAGPGFVHLGMDHYRHNDVEFSLKGSWRMRPKQPSSVDRWDDGAFGLGGILHAGYAGQRIAAMTVKDPALATSALRWDLCYKPATTKDRFELTVGGAKEVVAPSDVDPRSLRHLQRMSTGEHRLEVHVTDGGPDFCGVFAVTDPSARPGVVLDNLGINGARYATALAWEEKAWAAELVRTPTDLLIFEYGGNEASDGVLEPERYERNAVELVARAKRAVPAVACLLVGPADRVDRSAQIPPIVEAVRRAAAKAGCGFWDTWKAMGGTGSLARWRDEGKASADGVHLVPKGYAELAALLTQDLLAGYRND